MLCWLRRKPPGSRVCNAAFRCAIAREDALMVLHCARDTRNPKRHRSLDDFALPTATARGTLSPEWDTSPHIVRMLKLNSLVEIEVKWFTGHTPGDNDLMTALRGFQLHTGAHFMFGASAHKGKVKVRFTVFHASVADRYDSTATRAFPFPIPTTATRSGSPSRSHRTGSRSLSFTAMPYAWKRPDLRRRPTSNRSHGSKAA